MVQSSLSPSLSQDINSVLPCSLTIFLRLLPSPRNYNQYNDDLFLWKPKVDRDILDKSQTMYDVIALCHIQFKMMIIGWVYIRKRPRSNDIIVGLL